MYPIIAKIGPITIHTYGLMLALAFLVSVFFISRDAKKWGIEPNFASDTALWTLVAGIIGTRVAYIIMFPEAFSWTNPIGWIAIWQGGLVFQGAVPPALAVIWYRLRRRGIPFWSSLDMAAPYVPLAHAIGRMGCFFNGCCYGVPTSMPWGIRFPKGSPVYDDHCIRFGLSPATDQWSLPVHPTQLYSVALLVLLFVLLLKIRNCRSLFDGAVVILYFMLYCVGRFVVEMFRGDHNPVHIFSLSDQQVFCVVGFVLTVGLYFFVRSYMKRHPSAPPKPL